MSDSAPLRPYRQFGIVRHTFPDMTGMEKAFVWAFVVSGVVAIFAVRSKPTSELDYAFFAPFMALMCGVLGYWMRNEPEAVLQFLLFPFTGWRLQWPRFILTGVRAFGVFAFFSGLLSAGTVILSAVGANDLANLVVLALAVAATVRVLRKRREGLIASPTSPVQLG